MEGQIAKLLEAMKESEERAATRLDRCLAEFKEKLKQVRETGALIGDLKDKTTDATLDNISAALTPAEETTDTLLQPVSSVARETDCPVVVIDSSDLAAPTPTTCSTGCSSHEAPTLVSALASSTTWSLSTTTREVGPELTAHVTAETPLPVEDVSPAVPMRAEFSHSSMPQSSRPPSWPPPVCDAGHGVVAIDTTSLAAPTTTEVMANYSTECSDNAATAKMLAPMRTRDKSATLITVRLEDTEATSLASMVSILVCHNAQLDTGIDIKLDTAASQKGVLAIALINLNTYSNVLGHELRPLPWPSFAHSLEGGQFNDDHSVEAWLGCCIARTWGSKFLRLTAGGATNYNFGEALQSSRDALKLQLVGILCRHIPAAEPHGSNCTELLCTELCSQKDPMASVDQLMMKSGRIIQCGFELLQWKIAWSATDHKLVLLQGKIGKGSVNMQFHGPLHEVHIYWSLPCPSGYHRTNSWFLQYGSCNGLRSESTTHLGPACFLCAGIWLFVKSSCARTYFGTSENLDSTSKRTLIREAPIVHGLLVELVLDCLLQCWVPCYLTGQVRWNTAWLCQLSLLEYWEKAKNADAGKTALQELDGLNFMEDTTVAITNLLASAPAKIKCADSVVVSSFNPPPSYIEGSKYCITARTKSFYVNASNGSVLDSRPLKQSHEASTLVGLLQKLSAKFKEGFREILDCKASAHIFANVQALLPVTSWLGAHPIPEHNRDATRAEDWWPPDCQQRMRSKLQECLPPIQLQALMVTLTELQPWPSGKFQLIVLPILRCLSGFITTATFSGLKSTELAYWESLLSTFPVISQGGYFYTSSAVQTLTLQVIVFHSEANIFTHQEKFCSTVPTSVFDLGSLEFIENHFPIIHEHIRKLASCLCLEKLWSSINLVRKNQEQWKLYEHHVLERAAVCSIPRRDKLQGTNHIMSMSVRWKILSQEEFKGSGRFAIEIKGSFFFRSNYVLAGNQVMLTGSSSSLLDGVEFSTGCGQALFQGGRSNMVLHAFIDHYYHLDALFNRVISYYLDGAYFFELAQVYFDNVHHRDYSGTKEHQLPWDPGGNSTASAWGQAEFQGGRIVSDPHTCSCWAGIWTICDGLGPDSQPQ